MLLKLGQNYWIEDGNLTIYTNANTWERTKNQTISTYTTGTYTWRIFIPEMGVEIVSLGALYTQMTLN
jgi:hypothetical protein